MPWARVRRAHRRRIDWTIARPGSPAARIAATPVASHPSVAVGGTSRGANTLAGWQDIEALVRRVGFARQVVWRGRPLALPVLRSLSEQWAACGESAAGQRGVTGLPWRGGPPAPTTDARPRGGRAAVRGQVGLRAESRRGPRAWPPSGPGERGCGPASSVPSPRSSRRSSRRSRPDSPDDLTDDEPVLEYAPPGQASRW